MEKKVATILLLALLVGAAWRCFWPGESALRAKVDLSAVQHDPAKMAIQWVQGMSKSRVLLPNHIECGLIHLEDGGDVKFWFLSHHIQGGLGLTRFDFADGEKAYMRGYFCCEVDLEGPPISNKASLLAFIAEKDGSAP